VRRECQCTIFYYKISIYFYSSLNIPFAISLSLTVMTLRFVLILCSCTSSTKSPSFWLLTYLHPPYLSFSLPLTTYRNTSQNQRRIRFRQNIVQHYSNPDGMTTTSHTIRSQHSPSPNPDSLISLASGYRKPGRPPQRTTGSTPTGGKVSWKPVGTPWVNCRYWIISPSMYPPITFGVHLECNLNI